MSSSSVIIHDSDGSGPVTPPSQQPVEESDEIIDLYLEPVDNQANELMNQNYHDQELHDVLEECNRKFGASNNQEVKFFFKN